MWGLTWFLNILTGIVFFIDYGVFRTYGGTAASLMILGYFLFLVFLYWVWP